MTAAPSAQIHKPNLVPPSQLDELRIHLQYTWLMRQRYQKALRSVLNEPSLDKATLEDFSKINTAFSFSLDNVMLAFGSLIEDYQALKAAYEGEEYDYRKERTEERMKWMNPRGKVCWHLTQGFCKEDANCKFSHEPSGRRPVSGSEFPMIPAFKHGGPASAVCTSMPATQIPEEAHGEPHSTNLAAVSAVNTPVYPPAPPSSTHSFHAASIPHTSVISTSHPQLPALAPSVSAAAPETQIPPQFPPFFTPAPPALSHPTWQQRPLQNASFTVPSSAELSTWPQPLPRYNATSILGSVPPSVTPIRKRSTQRYSISQGSQKILHKDTPELNRAIDGGCIGFGICP